MTSKTSPLTPDTASDNSTSEERTAAEERSDANTYLGAGLGIGALGVAGGILGTAVCPLCIVATPALLGAGIYKRARARRKAAEESGEPSSSGPEAAP